MAQQYEGERNLLRKYHNTSHSFNDFVVPPDPPMYYSFVIVSILKKRKYRFEA